MLAVFSGPTCLSATQKADEKARKDASVVNTVAQWKLKADIHGAQAEAEAEFEQRLAALERTMEDEYAAKLVKQHWAQGVNGISYLKGPRCSFASHTEGDVEGVSAYFRGDLTNKFINEIHIDRHLHDEDDCHKVIHMYHAASTVHSNFATEDFSQSQLMAHEVEGIHGPFAFIVYDRHWRRIVAARDPDGKEPLFWTASASGDRLFFATDKAALFENAERVQEFPKGGLYISRNGSFAGTLNGEVLDSPRDVLKTKRELAEKAKMDKKAAAKARQSLHPHSAFITLPPEPRTPRRRSVDVGSAASRSTSHALPDRSSRRSVDIGSAVSREKPLQSTASPFDLGGIKRSMRKLSTS